MFDLGFAGSRFTWTNKPKYRHNNKNTNNKIIMERLDKFFANHKWIELYQDSTIQHLPRTHSDHCPLLLNLTKPYPKPSSSFKFETMWLQHPNFKTL